jgi:hypothetical protein
MVFVRTLYAEGVPSVNQITVYGVLFAISQGKLLQKTCIFMHKFIKPPLKRL